MDETEARPPKTFSVEEANALLPRVVPLVQQLQGLQHSIIQTNQQLDELVAKLSGGNGYPIQSIKAKIEELTRHQLQLLEAFESALKQLEDLGVVLKDLTTGLVDFYSRRGEDLVFLCWKLGEPRIQFWHTLDAGYASRQPLE